LRECPIRASLLLMGRECAVQKACKRTSNRIFAAAIFGAEVESCRHRESSIAGTGAVRKRIK